MKGYEMNTLKNIRFNVAYELDELKRMSELPLLISIVLFIAIGAVL